MMIFFQLFIVFIQIGIFGFGGGYSMISLIQGQVVTQYHWMTMQEFTDVVAISQMTPGPIGINTATYCGYTAVHNAGMSGMMAVLGSAMATFALVLPSLVLMILISKMLYKYMNTTAVQSIFIGLRPAIVGLVGAAALLLMNGENFSTPANPWHFYISIALFFATFIGVKVMKINPIRMILYSAFRFMIFQRKIFPPGRNRFWHHKHIRQKKYHPVRRPVLLPRLHTSAPVPARPAHPPETLL